MARQIEVSESEILDALKNAHKVIEPDPPGVFVVSELAEKSGRPARTIREQLRHLSMQGRLEVLRVRREGCDGKVRAVPAYRILPKARR